MSTMKHEKASAEIVRDTGVRIDSSYSVRIPKISSMKYQLMLLHLLLLVSAVLSTVYCLITAIEIQVDHTRLIGITCFFCVLFWGMTLMERASYTLIPATMFLFVLMLNERLDMLVQGFYHLENHVIDAINKYYNLKLFPYEVATKNGTPYVTVLMITVTFFLSWFYAYFIGSGAKKLIYLITSFAFIVAPCMVGRIPHTLVLMVYTVTMFGMLGIFSAKRIGGRQKKQGGSRHMQYLGLALGACCMLVATLSLLVFSVLIRKDTYDQIPIEDWKTTIQERVANLDVKTVQQKITQLTNTTVSVGGLAGGKLDVNNGRVTYNHSKQLVVTMVKPNTGIYLKGFTGVNYTGEAWTQATKEQQEEYQEILKVIENGQFSLDDFSILNLVRLVSEETNSNVSVMPSDMTIEYKRANEKFLYYPYYTWFGGIWTEDNKAYQYHDLLYSEEYVVPKIKNSSYTLRYYNADLPESSLYKIMQNISKTGINTLNTLAFDQTTEQGLKNYANQRMLEKEYREYVYHTYLSLPETGLDQLIGEFRAYKEKLVQDAYLLQNGVDVYQAIDFVRDYLWQHADYTLSPGKTPADQDYIEYFVYTNHKGYCAHYASAASMMLRALGVPTRYVEGYYIAEDAIESAELTSGNSKDILGTDELMNGNLSHGADVFSEGTISKEVRPEIQVTVEDSQAHSWVEIYLDGFGWYPVEFTEAASSVTQGVTPSPTVTQAPTVTPEEEKQELEKTPEVEETEKEKEEALPTQAAGKKPSTGGQNGGTAGTTAESKGKINTVIIGWILGIAAFIGLIWGFHMYRWGVWSKYFSIYDTSHMYRIWYQRLEKLRKPSISMEDLNHQLTFEEWQQTGEEYYGMDYEVCRELRKHYLKAVYSKESLDKVELQEARKLLKKMYLAIYAKKPRLVKLWYRYYVVIRF